MGAENWLEEHMEREGFHLIGGAWCKPGGPLDTQRRALLAEGRAEPSDAVLAGRPGSAAWADWLAGRVKAPAEPCGGLEHVSGPLGRVLDRIRATTGAEPDTTEG